MRSLFHLLLLTLSLGSGLADTPVTTPATTPEGIIILNPAYQFGAVSATFTNIQWINTDGGFATDTTGQRVPFTNDAISKVIYFDQAFYDEIDHNQYWVAWRAGLQSREMVIPLANTISLSMGDLPGLQSEQQVLDDLAHRYPSGQALIAPLIASVQDEETKLSNGLVLRNGKWLTPQEAAAGAVVPVVGEVNRTTTFTTKSGKKYMDVKVTLTDAGLSVLTSDGGDSVPFDQLPDDLSPFPANLRAKISAEQAKIRLAAAAAAAPPKIELAAPEKKAAPIEPEPPEPTGFFAAVESFTGRVVHKIQRVFSDSTAPADATSNSTGTNSAVSSSAPPVASPSTPTETGSTAISSTPPATAPSSSTGTNAPPVKPMVAELAVNAVVLIKGDKSEGTGFLVRTLKGPVVVTNLHVISGNPNLKIFTSSGEQIQQLSLKGASDRDLAMFAIQDNHYTYLELADNVDQTAAVGDPAIVPGNSQGGEVMLKTNGNLLGIGPQRVEFNNPVFHGNSGGPVFDVKTGKVVAVASFATKIDPADEIAANSMASANSAIKGPMRYFGWRLDTVPSWETYDEDRFVDETLFLRAIDDENRALNQFLNNGKNEAAMNMEGPPGPKFYETKEKLQAANEAYHQSRDGEEQKTAAQEFAWSLETLAHQDIGGMQNLQSFYTYDRPLAEHELEYRKALKTEIEKLVSKVNEGGHGVDGSIGL